MYENHNPPTVVVGLVPVEDGFVAIRRGNPKEDGFDQMALPSGYQEKGETWQQALARELLEETGLYLRADANGWDLLEIETVQDGTLNLLFAEYRGESVLFEPTTTAEATEVVVVRDPKVVETFAYPTHRRVAMEWLLDRRQWAVLDVVHEERLRRAEQKSLAMTERLTPSAADFEFLSPEDDA